MVLDDMERSALPWSWKSFAPKDGYVGYMVSSAEDDMATDQPLLVEGRRIREMLISKRSDTLLRLFDFLLEQSARGHQPREAEIANAIFSNVPVSASSGQGGIRVHIFRLRKKLDNYYEGASGPRLVIPRGEYCIVLTDPGSGKAETPETAEPDSLKRPRRKLLIGAAVIILLANVAAAWFFWSDKGRSRDLANSLFWAPVAADNKHRTIIIGDYFLFGERGNPGLPTKILRDPSISSRDDFFSRTIDNARSDEDPVDLDLHFVTSNITYVIRGIWAALRNIGGATPDNVDVITTSQLNPDILKSSNLIYIGPLDSLGKLLRDPLFEASGFKIGASYNELVDKASGKHFASDEKNAGDNQIPRRDYGYIASIPGPANNRILILSGSGDQGMVHMADLVSDGVKLGQLEEKLGTNAQDFEALYQVRTMYSQNYGSTLLIARPVNVRGIWDRAASRQSAR